MVPAAIRNILYGFGRPGQLLLHALYSPPNVVMHKALRLVVREVDNRLRPLQERRRCPYPSRDELVGRLSSRLSSVSVSPAALAPLVPSLKALVPLYLSHHVDLLGSGWVKVAHGETYAGFLGHRYGPFQAVSPAHWRSELADQLPAAGRNRALELLGMIDDPHYHPIDWHVDFKSGHRWNPSLWGRNISFESGPGVDFKTPLELARMHHLSHLALAYAASGNEALPREF